MEKQTRLVPGTRAEERKTLRKVLVTHYQEITNGCSTRCAGLRAYTKTSLRRAIKENDLTASGSCYTCGLRALVGEGRKRVESAPFSVMEEIESVETVQVPCMIEETYYVEAQSFQLATLIAKPKITVAPSLMAPIVPVKKIMNVKKQQGEEKVTSLEPQTGKSVLNLSACTPTRQRLGRLIVASYEQNIENCFKELDATCAKRREVIFPEQVIVNAMASAKEEARRVQELQEKQVHEAEVEIAFANGSDNTKFIDTEISSLIRDPIAISFKSPYWKKNNKVHKHEIRKKVNRMTENQLNDFMKSIIKICRRKDMPLFINDRKKKSDIYTHPTNMGRAYCRVHLQHFENKLKQTDLKLTDFSRQYVLPNVCIQFQDLRQLKFEPGNCGLIVDSQSIPLLTSEFDDKFFILRGKILDKYIDARETLNLWELNLIEQYSAGAKFWAGYERKFCQHRPKNISHTCESNFNVEECGEIAALLTQAIYPCGRITCLQCAKDYAVVNDIDLQEWIRQRRSADCVRELLHKSEYPHLERIVNFTTLHQPSELTNTETFEKIHSLVGSITEMPFKQLNELNAVLLRMGVDHKKDYVLAVDALHDIVKYIKNRTDSIARAELVHFRNKRSAKTHYNADLMCDNQLDKNGNFVWGLRGYHAKRFFSNYFEKVTPREGYDKFVTRKSPNGSRQLAISKLIVSTNFATFRQQMQGEPVELLPITEECVGRRRGNFLYPCCCVTYDDGAPALSEFVLPTKHHLVLGNTGDAKYVEMPTDENQTMYIAKEGYCYINIFFAMLINVSEDNALKFTKMVRDTIVPRLKQWPSMMDVATACYMLTIFFPDTASAELPRILVDHKSKTMHVLDSYGSVTTGYHILKANTVQQLCNFADGQLESDMKHYCVGGIKAADKIHLNVKWLIKGVYNPEFMKRVIEDEPFILLLSMLSPSVLMALFNSGSLELATTYWMHKRQTIGQIMTMLSLLAGKVSGARALTKRLEIISDSAEDFLTMLDQTFEPFHSVYSAQLILMQMIEIRKSDEVVKINGFGALRSSAHIWVEKNYQQDLLDAWGELSLWEKFSLIIYSKRLQREYTGLVPLGESSDLIAKVSTSLSASLVCLGKRIKSKITKTKNRVKCKLYELTGRSVCGLFRVYSYYMPDFFTIFTTLSLLMCFLSVIRRFNLYMCEYKALKEFRADKECGEAWHQISYLYFKLKDILGVEPTKEEFISYLERSDTRLVKIFESWTDGMDMKFQARSREQANLERIVAVVALILMVFDAERSDCVYKILNKLRTLVGITGSEQLRFQSLDEAQDLLEDKKLTVDFEISNDDVGSSVVMERTFGQWWSHQLTRNITIPHYRTEGTFMEFTRANAAEVAASIAHGDSKDVLLRGAVGSGKSTALPFHLSNKGFVLLIEPTRPLAENVFKQLRREPFNVNPSLRMRGNVSYGSSPIAVMTSGYALHFYAHNPSKLKEIDFIIIDECHVQDANAMAFRCLLHEFAFSGRVIKASATPPGREVTFTTQEPVEVKTESSMSLEQFAHSQGTGANVDATVHGNNILVYVSSYNEVDQLSDLLIKANFKVTKIDGRTMKNGGTEIVTSGTDKKKHFIVATNIIENGVTLDIEVVVDFGVKVVAEVDCEARAIKYTKKSISYGERIQRCGRVGRHKKGCAIRIGNTEKGIQRISSMVATEAAFYCFTYGLPVMTDGVSTAILENCTVQQARTMLHFELPIFFTSQLVRFDGSMHPEIHKALVPYKLRDSEIALNKLAIPSQVVCFWKTSREMAMHGCRLQLDDSVLIPFYSKDVPFTLYEKIHETVRKHKSDAGFGRISSYSAARVAYTLQTDSASIQRTVHILDKLIEGEMMKRDHFANATSVTLCSKNWSLSSLVASMKARHMTDHTVENISVLQAVKAQLLEFKNVQQEYSKIAEMENSGALECMFFQNEKEMSKHLGLKGHWNKSMITKDVMILIAVSAGCAWMAYEYFSAKMSEPMEFQGRNKRERQKLKFRAARDNKRAYEVHGEEADLQHYFGDAYTKKGKGKGTTHGMGLKNRRFMNMYSFDPTEYSFARYVDPLTGHTLDEQVTTDMQIVQEHFGNIRRQFIIEDLLDPARKTDGIQAYFVKNLGKQVLKIDLTAHNPMRVCDRFETIAGFPEREFELRQTGAPTMLPATALPVANEFVAGEFEGKTTFSGMRDYNPIAQAVCHLENDSNGVSRKLYGIGYGSVIITNQHLFKENNGVLRIKTHHGEYVCPNTITLNMFPVSGCDILLIQMPKDFVPFPRRLRFRQTKPGERVCMVGSNFQTKSISSVVSESSATTRVNSTNFYKHWITTKDGQCGNPIVSPKDGCIVGIHSLASIVSDMNMYTGFSDLFEADVIGQLDSLDWTKRWKLNLDKANWGPLNIQSDTPKDECFKLSKSVFDLAGDLLRFQGHEGWLCAKLNGNLKAMAMTQNALVTKHVVKGKCQLFSTFLECDSDAAAFFKPLMGAYDKSRLNKEAYIKDFTKYASPIVVGLVDVDKFDIAYASVVNVFDKAGFTQCEYITDDETIFQSLNMKAAVGALYSGKKNDYFNKLSVVEKDKIVRASCERLYNAQMGVWNGSLKAELRPIEKVVVNKTRSFTAAPLDTLLGGKVCVDDFNNKFYAHHFKIPSSVGMTKFYGGWDNLLKLMPTGWIYCDADGSQFDSSLSPFLINSVLNLRLHFMEDWDVGERMLRNLYTEIVYTPIATPDGTIVKKYKGNNSGQPSTVVDNTIMVMMAVHYSLIKNGVEDIQAVCRYVVNGDDLMIAVHPEHEYLLDVMAQDFQQLGLNYNFDSRSKDVKDLWFMSHKGIERDGLLIPKLEMERIVSILEWDRAEMPEHRLEAICASMIEAWGYDDLLLWIRKFYAWVLDQAPYHDLSEVGKAPYISEVALKALYTGVGAQPTELAIYTEIFSQLGLQDLLEPMRFQSGDTIDAGEEERRRKEREKAKERQEQQLANPSDSTVGTTSGIRDRDIDASTVGTFSVPKLKSMTSKLSLPRVQSNPIVNLDHLLTYKPDQSRISNARSTDQQFRNWYQSVRSAYELTDNEMRIVMNGLMVWCIENGTSPNINGMWVMMDGDEQVEYPIKPLIDHARPTFRQIMTHFSPLAEAYIEKQNTERAYMPRYGLQRNLTDMSLARYAFDFYEMNSRTPIRAREAHLQMKAAAIRNAHNRLFGLDGNVGTTEEDTERHTTNDVRRNVHHLMGAQF